MAFLVEWLGVSGLYGRTRFWRNSCTKVDVRRISTENTTMTAVMRTSNGSMIWHHARIKMRVDR